MMICWYEICGELTTWLDWPIVSPASGEMRSIGKEVGFEGFEALACTKGLRRARPLIDWNWGSGAELRLIAKTSVLNELNSLLDLRRSRPLTDQLTELREGTLICMWFKLFSDLLSLLSSKYDFLAVRAGYILREHWDDVPECMKEGVIGMARETSSRRILGSRIGTWYFDYWRSLMFGDSVLRLTCLLLLGRPKRYVERCFVYLMFLSLMVYS